MARKKLTILNRITHKEKSVKRQFSKESVTETETNNKCRKGEIGVKRDREQKEKDRCKRDREQIQKEKDRCKERQRTDTERERQL